MTILWRALVLAARELFARLAGFSSCGLLCPAAAFPPCSQRHQASGLGITAAPKGEP